ncbi:MAG: hypothetical protein AB1611_09510 [bacterium]
MSIPRAQKSLQAGRQFIRHLSQRGEKLSNDKLVVTAKLIDRGRGMSGVSSASSACMGINFGSSIR